MLNNFTIQLNDAGGKTAVGFNVRATHAEVMQRAAGWGEGRPHCFVILPCCRAAEQDCLKNNTLELVQMNEIGLSVWLARERFPEHVRLTSLLVNKSFSGWESQLSPLTDFFSSDL